MVKNTVSENTMKHKALAFIRSLSIKQIGEVLGEGDVMYNDFLDCFFVWKKDRLVMYVNENSVPKEDPILICGTCKGVITDGEFIRLDSGESFHYNPQCYPKKLKE